MKKFFTTPIRLLSAAVVLAGAGLMGALAYADAADSATDFGTAQTAQTSDTAGTATTANAPMRITTAPGQSFFPDIFIEANDVIVRSGSCLYNAYSASSYSNPNNKVRIRFKDSSFNKSNTRIIFQRTFGEAHNFYDNWGTSESQRNEALKDRKDYTSGWSECDKSGHIDFYDWGNISRYYVRDYNFGYVNDKNKKTKYEMKLGYSNIDLIPTVTGATASNAAIGPRQKISLGQMYPFSAIFLTLPKGLHEKGYEINVQSVKSSGGDIDYIRTYRYDNNSYNIYGAYIELHPIESDYGKEIVIQFEVQNTVEKNQGCFYGETRFILAKDNSTSIAPGFMIDEGIEYTPSNKPVNLVLKPGQRMTLMKGDDFQIRNGKLTYELKKNVAGVWVDDDLKNIAKNRTISPDDDNPLRKAAWFTVDSETSGEYQLTLTWEAYEAAPASVDKMFETYTFFVEGAVPMDALSPVISLGNAPSYQLKSGDAILKGANMLFTNPNYWLNSDGSPAITTTVTTTEDFTSFAKGGNVYIADDGSWSYIVDGNIGASHTFSIGLSNESGNPDLWNIPASINFNYTTTDQLPDPVFSIEGEWYDVQPGQAYGIAGINVVRANITNGTHQATACYDYHPSDDGTEPDMLGNNDVIEAAFLHGEGYKSSNVIFTRLNGQDPYELQAVKLYCNGKEISYGTYVYAGDILTIEDPNYYYGVTNDGVEALPKTFVDDLTIPSTSYKYIEEGKYRRDWSSNESTTPNGKNVSNTAIQTVKSNASAAFSSIASYMFKYSYHPYFPVVSTTAETSGSNLKQDIAIGSTVYVYNNFKYNVDWEYDWHCDIEGEEPTAPNTFPAAIMTEGSQGHYELPGGAMNAPVWDTFVLNAEPDKAINLIMYLTRKDDPTVRTNWVRYTITPKGEVLKSPSIILQDGTELGPYDILYMGTPFTVKNNNPAETGHVTARFWNTTYSRYDGLAYFNNLKDPVVDSDGSLHLWATNIFIPYGGYTGYRVELGMEVSPEFKDLVGVPPVKEFIIETRRYKPNEWTINFDDERIYPEDEEVLYLSPDGEITIDNTNRNVPGIGSTRHFKPVVTIDGKEVSVTNDGSRSFVIDETPGYGEHTMTVGYTTSSSDYRDDWYNYPEPLVVNFVVADEVLEAPYVEVDGNPLMGLDVTNWSKIRIINPNDVPGVMSLVSFVGNDGMTLEDIAYHGEVKELTVEKDGVNGLEFTLLDENCSSLMLELQSAVIGDDSKYYTPKAHAAFNVQLYQLLPPAATCRYSGLTYYYDLANTANTNVATCTVHYTSYNRSGMSKSDSGTKELTGSNAVSVAEDKLNVPTRRLIVGGYLTAPGCINSEPTYVTYQNDQHILTEPRLYVHNRPLSVYDLLAPGDVITIENPYQFEFGGEEISWHNPVEHTVTVGGDVVPESVEYEPWSGNWIVTIPSTVGDAPSTNQPGPAGVSSRAFNFYPITFTSTLTPKDEHTNAFAAGEPHTYSFNVDPGQQTGVEEISADELGDAEIFTISGLRMTGHDNLAPGFYIIVRGTSTEKVLIK